MRPRTRLLLLLLGSLMPLATSCTTTDLETRYRLYNPLMQLGMDPGEVHFLQKSAYSREGSVGGIGSSAGGGCGCY